MQVNKPITFYLPNLVNELNYCLEQNPPKFNYETVNFHFILFSIIDKQTHFKKYEFVPINKQELTQVIVSDVAKYIKYLEVNEFIISDKFYQVGIKTQWYKINSLYKGAFKIEVPINSNLYKKIKQARIKNNSNQNKLSPHLYSMYEYFKKVKFDFVNAENWIYKNVSNEKQVYYVNAINQLNDVNFRRFKRNNTNNRLDTNITNLSKNLRPFLQGDLTEIDLSNSQPFLLSVLLFYVIYNNKDVKNPLCWYFDIKKMAETFDTIKLQSIPIIRKDEANSQTYELLNFIEATKSGLFYDNFIKEYSKRNLTITRTEVKDIMFKVLFSKNVITNRKEGQNIPYKKEKEIFKKVYPHVYRAIEILKQNDNTKLPIYLQKIESFIFIDCIAKELVEAGIIPLTVHDSVIIESQHTVRAIEIMDKIFTEKIGIIPTFKISKL